MDSLFLKNCRGEVTTSKPVWMMRQAGRYLPEYLEVRSSFPDFLSFVHDAKASAKVTVQPVDRFGVDAGILFSDILVVLPLLGINVEFLPGVGPRILNPVRNAVDVANLHSENPAEALPFTKEAIERSLDLLRARVPLLGFIGGPLTLASYAIEGKTSKDLQETKKLFYRDPETFHKLMTGIAEIAGEYLRLQATWGCEALVIMDSWAGHLSVEDYRQMALPYTTMAAKIAGRAGVPILHYANGAGHLLNEFLKVPVNGYGLDWRTPLAETLEAHPETVFQGNLDPAMLFAPVEEIKKRTREILQLVKNRPHIMNLGHGVLPGTPIEGVQAFIDAVRAG